MENINSIKMLLKDLNISPINGQYYTAEEEANAVFIMMISTIIIIAICTALSFR